MSALSDKHDTRRLPDVGDRRRDADCRGRRNGAEPARDRTSGQRERRRMPDVGPPGPPPIITIARLP